MPAPRHFRITYSGVFGTPASPIEEWSMGLSAIAIPTGDYPLSYIQGAANAVAPLWGTHLGSIVSGITSLTRTRVSLIGPDGKTERTPEGAYAHADNMTTFGGAGSTILPLQTAAVVSLESAFEGPTGRGRFYLPGPSGTVGNDGLWAAATQTAQLNAAEAFVNAINAALEGESWGINDPNFGRLCVASGGSALQGLSPALRPVTRVGVGRVPDTQRRRRGDLLEQKVFRAVA